MDGLFHADPHPGNIFITTDGRIALRQPAPSAAAGAEPLADDGLVHAAKAAVKEARRVTARALRSHLASLDQGILEKACVKMLHALHFREVKVAKRGNHGPLVTARGEVRVSRMG